MVQVGAPLPNADRSVIPENKLRAYVLNPDHPDGRHKARVFRAALGMSQDDAEDLEAQILQEILVQPVVDVRPAYNGVRCSVVVVVRGPNDLVRRVMTGWRIPEGGQYPHLVTAYVLQGEGRT